MMAHSLSRPSVNRRCRSFPPPKMAVEPSAVGHICLQTLLSRRPRLAGDIPPGYPEPGAFTTICLAGKTITRWAGRRDRYPSAEHSPGVRMEPHVLAARCAFRPALAGPPL